MPRAWLGRVVVAAVPFGLLACVAPAGGEGGELVTTLGDGELSSGDDSTGDAGSVEVEDGEDSEASEDGGGDPDDGDDSEHTHFDLAPPTDGGDPGGTLCSDDLHQILDSDGLVLVECEPGTACHGGACLEMCLAAGLSGGSIGCEYYVPTPPFFANQGGGGNTLDGACHAVMIANAWDTPAQLELSFFGEDYDYAAHARIPSGIGQNIVYDPIPPDGIPAGQVAIVFLSHNTDAAHAGTPLTCPVPPAIVDMNTVAFGTGGYEAWELVSDTPVTVYDMLPYGGASSYLPSAALLQPRTAWGENYVVSTPHDTAGRAWVLAVGREDDTTISIEVESTVDPGTIAVPSVNVPTNYVIDAGETLQWMSSAHLVGTTVQADKPIGIFAGNTYLRVHTADSPSGGGHDSTHQQLPHVQALASEYVGPGIPSRKPDFAAESVLYQVVGVVDGTQLSYDPTPSPIAPLTLDRGQVVEFESTQPFTIRSQDAEHPFLFMQYMSGAIIESAGGCLGECQGLGDEEWINLVAPAQYMRRYVFFVDPTYGVGSLALVRTRGIDGEFEDVELECWGVVDGWSPIGDEGRYEVTHIDLYRGGVGPCAQSRQQAWSAAPFGIVVWGVDYLASYGYPAGGRARALNDLIVPVG